MVSAFSTVVTDSTANGNGFWGITGDGYSLVGNSTALFNTPDDISTFEARETTAARTGFANRRHYKNWRRRGDSSLGLARVPSNLTTYRY